VQPYLNVAVGEREGSTVVHVEGELDLGSAAQLEDVIARVRPTSESVVIDLADLWFIDMAGLRVLLCAHEEAEHEGTPVALANVREPVRRVLNLAHVESVLPVQEV
jgi:anti-anti-sigma factor